MFTGHWEWLILALVILLLFGSARLPSLMRNIGLSGRALQEGMRGERSSENDEETPSTV